MNAIFVIGRIAFVMIFIISGAAKLMDISATAASIAAKVAVPEELSSVAAQLESAVGMTVPQLLAVIAGIAELAAGLMLAANIGTRVAALLLIVFTFVVTFYYHDFWNLDGGERTSNLAHALKNLSLIGALLMFFVLGRWQPSTDYEDVDTSVSSRYS